MQPNKFHTTCVRVCESVYMPIPLKLSIYLFQKYPKLS